MCLFALIVFSAILSCNMKMRAHLDVNTFQIGVKRPQSFASQASKNLSLFWFLSYDKKTSHVRMTRSPHVHLELIENRLITTETTEAVKHRKSEHETSSASIDCCRSNEQTMFRVEIKWWFVCKIEAFYDRLKCLTFGASILRFSRSFFLLFLRLHRRQQFSIRIRNSSWQFDWAKAFCWLSWHLRSSLWPINFHLRQFFNANSFCRSHQWRKCNDSKKTKRQRQHVSRFHFISLYLCQPHEEQEEETKRKQEKNQANRIAWMHSTMRREKSFRWIIWRRLSRACARAQSVRRNTSMKWHINIKQRLFIIIFSLSRARAFLNGWINEKTKRNFSWISQFFGCHFYDNKNRKKAANDERLKNCFASFDEFMFCMCTRATLLSSI